MSTTGPSTPPDPPDPHRLARQNVRWAIIGVVVSSVLALVGLYQTSHGGGGGGTGGSSSSSTSGSGSASGSGGDSGSGSTTGDGGADGTTTDGAVEGTTDGTTTGGSPGPSGSGGTSDGSSDGSSDGGGTAGGGTDAGGSDGLTADERALRDTLNSDQWSRDSCAHTEWRGADAALYCTVTTVDQYGVTGTGKASVIMYGTKSDRDAVFQSYAARLRPGDCEAQTNAYGTWRENNTGDSAGDVVCFLSSTGQYVFLCSYYDRPALVQISGPDHSSLAAWWHTMEPVFSS
ncbi:hypothetical protein PYK79_51780 [Streptomyces sp. ID05-04B]|uniref:hypothetical protein n=1 Tax=unclassified Streptomyces TaxID=2593676 RepID=UPI000D19B93B|nr:MULTISPECIES: hypothetical protein [unclassified Streptomyces]AVV41996.1 hypothetical protein C6376_11725 [Streptomyces sp. P3]MDX5570088.1 hypothetical protein [Streptomyces sp. ID05-04B]